MLLLERRWSSANDSNVDVCLMMYSVINSQLVSISCVWPGSECQSNVRISNSDLMKINRLNIMRLSSQTCCRCSRFMIIASLALCAARGALIALRALNDTDVSLRNFCSRSDSADSDNEVFNPHNFTFIFMHWADVFI